MLKLFKFGPQWGIADPSPYCVKVESFLRLHSIAYEAPEFEMSFFKQAPKGKFPYIEQNGELLGDSSLIITALSKQYNVDLFPELDTRQKAVAHALVRMLDEHFYWPAVYSRWVDDAGWKVIAPLFFGEIPWPIRSVIENKQRKYTRSRIDMQGMGKHSEAEIYAKGAEDLQALNDVLGDDQWFLGAKQPTLLDIVCHAFVINMIRVPIETPLKDATLALPKLCEHAERFETLVYGALEEKAAA